MSESDSAKSWPTAERRARAAGDRRTKADRRLKGQSPAETAASRERRAADRRTGGDRRTEAGWLPLSIDPATAAAAEAAHTLLAAAAEARTRARARYSNFMVGAALITVDDHIITGCNIENATYGLTLCAERVALVKALSDGHAVFTAIAVVADTVDPTPPCGPCRQLLWEYCGDIDVILGNLAGPTARYRLSALLPVPFDARLLG